MVPRFTTLLACALLALPAVAASHDPLAPPPAGADCIAGLSAAYCADATAAASVSCTVLAATYTCSLSASWGSAGSTSGPLDGALSGPGWLDVTICDGSGCSQSVTSLGGACSWAWDGHGCSTSGSYSASPSGSHAGCIGVYVSVQKHAYVQNPLLPVTLVQQQAYESADFVNC
jgi:hypothetical protein